MKRLLLALGVLGMMLVLSCSLFDWHNDIEYPVSFHMAGETPGDTVTLNFAFSFHDQTPDTSGVIFDWEQRNDTLWFLLQGSNGNIEHRDTNRNYIRINVGVLDPGIYTLLFEGENGAEDTFQFQVEDSVYREIGDSGKVVDLNDGTVGGKELRRIFPDMLYVEVAGSSVDPTPYLDSLTEDLQAIGANVVHLSSGTYSLGHWSWDDAINNGLLSSPAGGYFTYEGDTAKLDSLYKVYIKKGWLDVGGALGMEMGNGFFRLYEWWEHHF